MIDYHHTVVHVWDFVWLMASIAWVVLWYRWFQAGGPLPKWVMDR